MPLPPRLYDRNLNSEIERILYQVKVVRQEYDGLTWGLNENQAHWAPDPTQWSVAECIDHLNISNAKFNQMFEKGISEGRAAGKLNDGPYTYGFLARWFRSTMEPPVRRRFKAPASFTPGPPKSLGELTSAWNQTHDRLIEILHEANGLDLAKVKVESPATRWIHYSIGIGFWIQTAHDRRHLWQARNVRNSGGFPA